MTEPVSAQSGTIECPNCKGKGTVVKDGPHRDEYDSHYPCWRCTTDRTQLVGTGRIALEKQGS